MARWLKIRRYFTINPKKLGQWFDDKAHGFGEQKHADGDIYRGDWEDDKANGQGTYIHANGTTYSVFLYNNYFKPKRYIGKWLDDKQHGYGVEEWPDGAKYEGAYYEGSKHDKGMLLFPDGSSYTVTHNFC